LLEEREKNGMKEKEYMEKLEGIGSRRIREAILKEDGRTEQEDNWYSKSLTRGHGVYDPKVMAGGRALTAPGGALTVAPVER
jgi:hypothetical protein